MKYTYNRIGLLPEGGRTGIKGHKWVVKKGRTGLTRIWHVRWRLRI